jgi:hypothetical protein
MRSERSLETLQWVGLLGAALIWTGQLVVGFGLTVAACGPAGPRFGIDVDTWEIALTATAAVFVLVAEAAALAVLARTRGSHHDDPPPQGRRHFFASAAAIANVLFLVVVLTSGIAALVHTPCGGS